MFYDLYRIDIEGAQMYTPRFGTYGELSNEFTYLGIPNGRINIKSESFCPVR